MITYPELREIIDFAIQDILEKVGFNNFNEFTHKYSWGIQKIDTSQLYISHSKGFFRTNIYCSDHIYLIEDFWFNLRESINIFYDNATNRCSTYDFSGRYTCPNYKGNFVNNEWMNFPLSEQGYLQFKEVAKDIITNYLIPKAEELRDLKVLDRMINYKTSIDPIEERGIFNDNGLVYRRMAIAKLTGNPLYEAICEDERQYFDLYNETSKEQGYEYFANIPKVFETVYNRLKDVQPLKNTVLGK